MRRLHSRQRSGVASQQRLRLRRFDSTVKRVPKLRFEPVSFLFLACFLFKEGQFEGLYHILFRETKREVDGNRIHRWKRTRAATFCTTEEWCGKQGFDLTFIETMPMGEIDQQRTDQYLPLTLVREKLEQSWTLDEIDYKTGGPARYVVIKETGKRLGFITPLSHNFCEECNRVRLTCTGKLYMCLGQDDWADLKTPLRKDSTDKSIMCAIDEAIGRKPKGHDFIIDRTQTGAAVERHMSVTGG